ncbi:BRO-N domain-containing protein [Pseudomonas citri]|uniref:BRO-N domain-containing protein n=1 Tax=Pseudomonas citri TaxID=2978349 RepID=UPI0021B5AD3A|nr:BRO family protein [Pseudomonas citri]
MKFVKQSFMGVDLDILIGHPEHDILFIATQVARAAGLVNHRSTVGNFKASKHCKVRLSIGEVFVPYTDHVQDIPKAENGRAFHSTTSLLTEPDTYQMLLRGHAPQSEPFRKWVTEEVLPAIRKTGSYNVNESETPEALQFSGEFAALHQALAELTGEVRSLKDVIAGLQNSSLKATPEPSPYEGQAAVAVCDPAGFQKRLYIELAEPYLDQIASERVMKRAKFINCLA